MPDTTLERLSTAMRKGLGVLGAGSSKADAKRQGDAATELGLSGVGFHSTEDDIAEYAKKLWRSQDDLIEDWSKEWRQHLYYCANAQYIAYHRDARRWIPRKTVPWRIRSIYNVIQKAVNVRVSRLTENKPSVAVQAATVDREDMERAEYKETLFWYLWERLNVHLKVVLARRWASKCASGFLKVGWDPEAGPEYPVTRKRVKYKTAPVLDPTTQQPVIDPATGQAAQQQVYDGVEEVYLDAKSTEIGPVETLEQDPNDPETPPKRVRVPIPEEADIFHEGEAYVDTRSPFNVRWDRYTDDLPDSWYVQDAEVLPLSRILALFPDKTEVLKDATPASEDDKALSWNGLRPRATAVETGASYGNTSINDERDGKGTLDKEYLVLETWVFPKNGHVKKLWGKKGALLITVGGKLVHKSTLPEWALSACPFVQFIDIPEEGNHYGKSFLRDLIPLQDDINRSRSHMAERVAMLSRIIFGAPQNHGISLRVLGGMPGVLVTYRSPQHKPEVLQMGTGDNGAREFYDASLAAAQDVGNMNEASTGKLPSAGLAAKAIYALQYADERSVTEASNLQDISLKRLALALDAVTRKEYKEARKVRLVGRDRGFITEHEISPDHLNTEVDYHFSPGSMLSRQKDAVKNELLTLKDAGLVDPATVLKYLPTSIPEAFREVNDLHEAKARRQLYRVLHTDEPVTPDPWDNPAVHVRVLEDFMLTDKYRVINEAERSTILQLWQAYRTMMLPPATAPAPAPGGAGGQPPIGAEGQPGAPAPPAAGAEALAATAEAAVAPPPGFPAPELAGAGTAT